jgi:dihydropteroate synthase
MNEKSLLMINIKGELVDLSSPLVMGIMNITPDSFYTGSRKQTEKEIIDRTCQLKEEGADIIDIGGYSSRPDAVFVSEEEEMKRLDFALPIVFREYPDAVVSVDTFRSEIAKRCVEVYGAAIINDISAGELDPGMPDTVAALQVPYIIMHMRGTPQTMMQYTEYDSLISDIFMYFSRKVEELRLKGVNDIILDPGFGFSKTTDQNYQLMNRLEEFRIFDLPVLVGISRKTMIRQVLDCTSEESLTGTVVLNTISLLKGASIIRVHDVKQAVQTVQLINKVNRS